MKRLILFLVVCAMARAESASQIEQYASALKSQLTASGYQYKNGKYFFLKDEHEDELFSTMGSSFGLNPGSPYGMLALPPGDGEPPKSAENWSAFFQTIGRADLVGMAPIWRIRRDEALVFIGYTPPDAKYFAFLNSVLSNPNGKSPGNQVPFHDTDTDLPVNQRSIGFNQLIAVIISSHQSLADSLRSRLIGLGFPSAQIFYQRISTEGGLLTTGYEEYATTFMMKNRVAYTSSTAYVDSPVASVFRVYPNVPISNPDTFPKFQQPKLTDGYNENHLISAQKALAEAVAKYHAKSTRSINIVSDFRFPLDTGVCLEYTIPCLGTIDTLYNFSLIQKMGGTSDDFTSVVGAFHTKTKKSTYTSVTLYDSATGASVGSASDENFAGSVKPFLPYVSSASRALVERYQDQLYVHRFARACDANDIHCTLVPTIGPVGTSIVAGAKYNLYERGYLNQRGNQGAAPLEVLAPLRVNSQAAP